MEVDFNKIKKDWASRGFSCELWVDAPGAIWEDFVHPQDELVMLVEGVVELEMRGKKILLQNGKEELIPAHVTHSVRNKGPGSSKWLYGYKRKGGRPS
jgi:quercetin dioxygenase-like cupin family protein